MLVPTGWTVSAVTDAAFAANFGAKTAPAAILLDLRLPNAESVVAAIRRLPVPLNGTPIIALGEGDGPPVGGGTLALPLDPAALRERLREWAGPLDDHALRRVPWSARYRLVRLLGLTAADATLARLKAALDEAIAADDDADIPAHRLAGIAGMCGFAELSRLWARVDRGELDALSAAREASRAASEQIAQADLTGPAIAPGPAPAGDAPVGTRGSAQPRGGA